MRRSAPLPLVPLALALLAAAPARSEEFGPARPFATRDVQLTYEVRVTEVPKGAEFVRIWLPMPMSIELQDTGNPRLDPPETPHWFVRDTPYGNRFLVIEMTPPPEGGATPPVTVRFIVLRTGYTGYGPFTGPGVRVPAERWLAPDPHGPLDGAVAEAARAAVGDATDPLVKARRIFDALVAGAKLETPAAAAPPGDAARALAARAGDARDLAALFVAEARSAGVPARFVSGFALPREAKEGSLLVEEAWAEIRVEGKGWLPVDPAAALRNPGQPGAGFGTLDANRVQVGVGRDVTVAEYPGPHEEIVAWPIATVNNKPVPRSRVETLLRFANR